MSSNPTSRFQVLERPVAVPGKCLVCGSGSRKVIDFGADIEEGAVYFCIVCILEAAGEFGAVPKEVYEQVVKERDNLMLNSDKVKECANQLGAAISTSSARFIRDIQSLVNATTPEEPSDSSAGDGEAVNGTEPNDSKPARGKRSSGVPADSGSSVFNPAV